MTFNFVELPDRTGGPEHRRGGPPDPLLFEFAKALRGNPGSWAEWPKPIRKSYTAISALVARINNPKRQGHPAAFRDGRFEGTARGGMVYVRYVGEVSA